jgi:hypothetical protein
MTMVRDERNMSARRDVNDGEAWPPCLSKLAAPARSRCGTPPHQADTLMPS